MKVYCAFHGEYSSRMLIGVHTTLQAAEEDSKQMVWRKPGEYYTDVEEVELEGPEVAELEAWLVAHRATRETQQ